MIKGTCDFYSLQMYSTRLVTKKDPSNDAKLMEDMKERIKRAPDIELPGHELDTLLYWFRPGWYGDMQVWTALDQECLSYFVLFYPKRHQITFFVGMGTSRINLASKYTMGTSPNDQLD